MGAKLVVAFLLFYFRKKLLRFKVKLLIKSMHFVEEKYKL